MSLELTATPSKTSGTVSLVLESNKPVVTLTRSDVNGTRPVRLPAGALPGDGTLRFTDFEPALTGQVQYRAYTATEEASAWITLGGQLPRFVMPTIPLYSVEARNVFAYSAPRTTRSTVKEVVGRRGPIVIQAPMGTRRGTLSVLCDDHQEVLRLSSMLERGQTVFYRQSEHAGMDMYFHATEVEPVPNSGKWELNVTYVELEYPTGPVQSDASWTFAKLAKEPTTFAAVANEYTDYSYLVLKEKKTP